eukprot:11212902-Lingulodinium_polyedra.AAC.1
MTADSHVRSRISLRRHCQGCRSLVCLRGACGAPARALPGREHPVLGRQPGRCPLLRRRRETD